MMRRHLVALVSLLVLGPGSVVAEDTTGTFTLDGLSYISFGARQILFPESGGTIVFRFASPNADGSVPFTIQPEDVQVDPIPLVTGGTLLYSLAAPASGTLRATPAGKRVDFTATVRATLESPGNSGSFDYTMAFTTETATAPSADGSESASVAGMRLVDQVWYGQIVAATTNRDNAFPEPGVAVTTALSGTFDQVP